MEYRIKPPDTGEKITIRDGQLQVPDNPVIPYVEGDGTGRDIWRASSGCWMPLSRKAYRGKAAGSPGWRFSPAKKLSIIPAAGCPNNRGSLPGIPGRD